MVTNPIRWLHLSDFHVGKDGYAHRRLFESILEHVAQKKADEGFVPDFLFITGDLANAGLKEEYTVFWKEFVRPLQHAIGGGIAARTFVVPGNHDVNRKKNKAFNRAEIIGDADYFHADANGQELRSILLPRFEAFQAADQTLDQEVIFSEAGAFGRLVPWQGYQVGIAGINTAWLCKDNDDKEKLTPGKALLENALARIGPADLRIVLGHHPIDWLLPEQQRPIKSVLGKPGVLYLHGHLHEQWMEPTHGGGGQFLAIQTGAAFQAEEHDVWRNGLLWGEADLAAHKLGLQPYEWSRNHQEWVPKGDAFHPKFKDKQRPDWWMYDLPGKPAPAPATLPPPSELTAATAASTRLALQPLPPDSWIHIRPLFVGRENFLQEVAQAVKDLHKQAAKALAATRRQQVKLVWVHGFGGMGKSWFLHCARQQAEDVGAARALIIQWDSPEWGAPLRGVPSTAEELFNTLAYRLEQVMGPAATTLYQEVVGRIKAVAPERARLLSQFENQLRAAYNDKTSKLWEETRRLLRREQLRNRNLTKRQDDMDRWRDSAMRYDSGFAGWCRAGSRSTEEAVIDPDSLRADTLRQALRQAAAQQPLLLLLDTGEVLNEDMDTWLRWLLMPLVCDDTPLLVLIGSRKKPDIDQPDGSSEGWLAGPAELRVRQIDFTEALLFTVNDIGKMLINWPSLPTREYADLAKRLYRLTLGVPLAVYTLLNLYKSGDQLTTLSEPSEQELAAPDEGSVIRTVIEKTVGHLMRYLPLTLQSDDLHDIITLVLLQWADPKVLQSFWCSKPPEVWTRLRYLDKRYGLLAGNDLHATVRNYLRQHWRYEDRRPAAFDSVLAGLRNAIEDLPNEFVRGSADAIGCTLRHLNLLAWQQPVAVLPLLTQLLAVALAYDVKTEAIEALLQELAPPGKNYRLWQAPDAPTRPEIIHWLQQLPTANWPAFERGCLALTSGLALISNWRQMKVEETLTALQLLGEAVATFSLADVPQAPAVGQAYFQVARSLQNSQNGSINWPGRIELAYRYAIVLRTELATANNNLGNLLGGQFGRAEEAERHYLAAIANDPSFCFAHNNLGHLLAGRKQETKARQHYHAALSLDRQNATGHRGLAWLALLAVDLPAARTHATEARYLSAGQAGMLFLEVALAIWTDGWEASRGMLIQWLQDAPSWLILPQDYRLIALFRNLREQGALADLAFVLQAMADERLWWRPWHEAVAALATGQGAAACTTEQSRTLYQSLSE